MVTPYYIHMFPRSVKDGAATSERDVVLLGPKNRENWVAGFELRGEARKLLSDMDKREIAEFIERMIESRKKGNKGSIIVQPIIGLIKQAR